MNKRIPPVPGTRLIPLLLILSFLLAVSPGFAQVDVTPRRSIQIQTGFPAGGDERIYPLPYFWFNRDDFPWKGTALRLIYVLAYVDSELSWFLPSHPKTALGGGLGGGTIADLITPYVEGERLSQDEFNVGLIGTRIFVNQELAPLKMGGEAELPMNVRLTYGIARGIFTRSGNTAAFVLPREFLTRSVQGELRLGGLDPGLTADRGLEVYASMEAGFRSGFRAFGPEEALYPAQDHYRRSLLSTAAKIAAGRNVYFGRISGGIGEGVDELSAWKLGGNCVGFEPFLHPLHGFYTQEFLAEDFGILSLAWSRRILDGHRLTVHVYADHAEMKLVPPNLQTWIGRSGVGAGIGFRALGGLDWLISYGYGINPTPDGGHGNHEFAVALERSF
jgi:hypothetical protein